jgi:hypothetical protein
MNIRYFVLPIFLLAAAIFSFTAQSNAQRARPAKVTSLQATRDSGVQHPATAEIAGPVPITCLSIFSETPNPQAAMSCHITAPGFTGNLNKGEKANATGAGTVTLTCNGPGNLRCSARIN